MRLTVKLIAVNIMGTAIKVEDMEGIVALADWFRCMELAKMCTGMVLAGISSIAVR